jgi:hypothetical protein
MLNYKLQRIVSSGNIHQQINLGHPLEVDVIAEQYIYCKLRIKDIKEQLVFKCFKKIDPNSKIVGRTDLKILISWNSREPTETHYDKMIVNVRIVASHIFFREGSSYSI